MKAGETLLRGGFWEAPKQTISVMVRYQSIPKMLWDLRVAGGSAGCDVAACPVTGFGARNAGT